MIKKFITLHVEYRQMDVCGGLQRMREMHYFPTKFQYVKSMRHLLIDQININRFFSRSEPTLYGGIMV